MSECECVCVKGVGEEKRVEREREREAERQGFSEQGCAESKAPGQVAFLPG